MSHYISFDTALPRIADLAEAMRIAADYADSLDNRLPEDSARSEIALMLRSFAERLADIHADLVDKAADDVR